MGPRTASDSPIPTSASSTHHKKNIVVPTSHTKHPQHHLAPSASTALTPSLILLLHPLHFGIRSRTWHASQYAWPLYTVNPTSSSINSPSPVMLSSPVRTTEGGSGPDGARNGSPHSAQKKCCSWYIRLPNAGSSSVMNRSSMMAVLQWKQRGANACGRQSRSGRDAARTSW